MWLSSHTFCLCKMSHKVYLHRWSFKLTSRIKIFLWNMCKENMPYNCDQGDTTVTKSLSLQSRSVFHDKLDEVIVRRGKMSEKGYEVESLMIVLSIFAD
jgi:hypothetical protein